jgi:RNA polymerase-binding transcription factor DksA
MAKSKKKVAATPVKKSAAPKKKPAANKKVVKTDTKKAKSAPKAQVKKPIVKSKTTAKAAVNKPAVKAGIKAAPKKVTKTAEAVKKSTKTVIATASKPVVKPTTKVTPQVEGKAVVKPIVKPSVQPAKKKETELRTRYKDDELEEFRLLILDKLDAARKELKYLQDQINRKGDNGTDDTENKFASSDDGSSSMEREYLNQMAARQIMYMDHLDKALVRIQNKTYGICRVTGKLIEKERLKSVPHATLSMQAKMMQSH